MSKGKGRAATRVTSLVPDDVVQSYYTNLLQDRALEDRVNVVPVEGKGRGLVACRDYAEGDVILTDLPATQWHLMADKIPGTENCRHCGQFLGSYRSIVDKLSGPGMQDKPFPFIDEEDTIMGDLVSCTRQCGMYFCSNKCRDRGELYHAALCVKGAKGVGESGAFKFKRHALAHNESFILVGAFLASVAHRVKHEGVSVDTALCPMTVLQSVPWEEIVTGSIRAIRDDHDDDDDDDDDDDCKHQNGTDSSTKSIDTLRDTLKESYYLLMETLEARHMNLPQFTLELYSRLLGACELNCITVDIENPVREYIEAVEERYQEKVEDAEGDEEKIAQVIAEVQPLVDALYWFVREADVHRGRKPLREPNSTTATATTTATTTATATATATAATTHDADADDDDGDPLPGQEVIARASEYLPRYYGIALFPLLSMVNHACQPVCVVEYNDDNTVHLIASTDIPQGKELSISYIDESEDEVHRRRALRDYQFVCQCPLCLQER